MTQIHCWNEYDSLKTVILGSVYDDCNIPELFRDQEQEDFVKIVNQSNKELKNFQKILENFNVNVLRPTQPKNYNSKIFNHEPLINMRDFYLAYGNLFFTTNNPYLERRYQHLWLEPIINQLINEGNLIVNANDTNFNNIEIPKLDDILNNFDDFFKITGMLKPKKQSHLKSFLKNLNNFPNENFDWLMDHNINNYSKNLFHTASLLKDNSRCFISNYCGTDLGKQWMLNWLKFLKIEAIFVPTIGHLDSEISIINKNSILTLKNDTVLSPYFKNTICIEGTKNFYNNLDYEFVNEKTNPSLWLYKWQPLFKKFSKKSNCLSINENILLVSFYDKTVYQKLKNIGIEAIYVEWSNDVWWEGSLHCITCDIERRPE
jgi:N-dimethylarginine dimethylaminohydrolase